MQGKIWGSITNLAGKLEKKIESKRSLYHARKAIHLS